ncbi:hypothetical protein [Sphingomonas arenae]|uniref:hypothetical protein n=1 Tax=Sphingomonas arenae TaxID=2812555 RepID=UPI001967D868|nr:hypothetical protein [Sphingomonas arenae]
MFKALTCGLGALFLASAIPADAAAPKRSTAASTTFQINKPRIDRSLAAMVSKLTFKLGKDGQDFAVPGPDMPMAMRTVLKRYFQHPRVRLSFKDELERRQSEYGVMARFQQARQGRMGGR